MAKKLFKSVSMCYNDDDSISIKICPVEKEIKKDDEDEKDDMTMGMMMGGYEEIKATAKDMNEAVEKIKGIMGLSAEKGGKPKNIITAYLKG